MANKLENNNNLYLDNVVADRFARYAKYIIQERALPNINDGLKPVQRRIIYAMQQLKITHEANYKKSARIVGEVIGKYHPHGDASVYDALVRMSQPWKLRYPLIDFQGNKGSIDGDTAAAMRYTEVRLAGLCEFLYKYLNPSIVTFADNFDNSEIEPLELPAQLPFVLLNGTSGIAAGYASNIPSHNLREVIKATIKMIENPNITLGQILKIIKGPDFPTGGILTNPRDFLSIYKKGQGVFKLESKIKVGPNSLVVTEIPFNLGKTALLKQLDKIRFDKPNLQIKQIIDESDRNGLRINIKLASAVKPEFIKNYLLAHSSLRLNFNYNCIVIVDGKPQQLNLKEILHHFITFNQKLIKSELRRVLALDEKQLEIVRGLIRAQDIIDQVIKIIRTATNKITAIEGLIKQLQFSEVQAESIVNLRLYRLTSTMAFNFQKEASELQSKIDAANHILASDKNLAIYQAQELNKIADLFADDRRTLIKNVATSNDINEMDLAVKKDIDICFTRNGYVRITAPNSSNLAQACKLLKQNDVVVNFIHTSNFENVKIITSAGRATLLKLYNLGFNNQRTPWTHFYTMHKMADGEKIIYAAIADWSGPDARVLLTTKNGMTKQMLSSNMTWSYNLQKIIKLKPSDELKTITLNKQLPWVVYLTKSGYSARYQSNDLPLQSQSAMGVKALSLKANDELLGGYFGNNDDNLLVINDVGQYKKLSLKKIALFNRPVTGVRYFPRLKTSNLAQQFVLVNNEDAIYVINKQSVELQALEDCSLTSHNLTHRFSKITDFNIAYILWLKNKQTNKNHLLPNLNKTAQAVPKVKTPKSDDHASESINLTLNFEDLL